MGLIVAKIVRGNVNVSLIETSRCRNRMKSLVEQGYLRYQIDKFIKTNLRISTERYIFPNTKVSDANEMRL